MDWTDAGSGTRDETSDSNDLPAVGLSELRNLRIRCELIRQRSENSSVPDLSAQVNQPQPKRSFDV